MEQLWRETQAALQAEMDAKEYHLWIDPIRFVHADDERLTLALPNKFYESWIRDHYADRLRQTLAQQAGRSIKLYFVIDPSHRIDEETPRAAAKRLLLDDEPSVLSPPGPTSAPLRRYEETNFEQFTFDTFIVGPSNRFAFAAAQGACSNPGKTYNPLFIYGGVGLGKTHLLRAIVNECRRFQPGGPIIYMTAEEFTNDLIAHVKQKRMDEFREHYRTCNVLLLDDIQFIAGKERTQEEIFHTFNTLYDAGRQIIIAADQIPRDIPGLEDRLRSRFDWGLLADIQPPEIETKVAIIERKAESLRLSIPSDVAFFLASIPGTSIRQIEGILIRLAMHASLDKVPITLEFARRALKQAQWIHDRPLGLDEIIKRVADHFNVRVIDLKGRERKKTLTLPRHVAMYLCRQLTSRSYPEIGQAFGGKDHATVMHAERKIKREIAADTQLSATVELLSEALRG